LAPRTSNLRFEAVHILIELNHRGNFACTRCHNNNSEVVNWSSPGYRPNCAGCHAQDYKAGEDDHNGLANDQNCGQSGCHRITNREW
jgi:hypothetical protein